MGILLRTILLIAFVTVSGVFAYPIVKNLPDKTEPREENETKELQGTNNDLVIKEEPGKTEDIADKEGERGEKNEEKQNETTPPSTPVPAPTPAQQPTSPPTIPLPKITADVNSLVRAATVNIFCTTKTGGALSPASGSGAFVDTKGVILTNAHIAQYLLLKDYLLPDFVSCVIRGGSPARNMYKARLLYLPPEWVSKNGASINLGNPTGTGEHDFAFLLVDSPTSESVSLPSQFPALLVSKDNKNMGVGTEILITGYPAGFLGGITIAKDLNLISTISSVKDLFRFGEEGTLDVVSLGGSIVAQKGSSGAPVVTGDKVLQGLVVTSTEAESTGDRDLHAITTGHIDRSLKKFTGADISGLLSGDLKSKADAFNEKVAPGLSATLIKELEK